MKVLILRTFPDELNIKSYNVQEIGLAKALVNEGHQCDIVLYTKTKERIEEISVENKTIKIYWMRGLNLLKNLIWPSKIFKLINEYDIIQSCEYDQIYNIYLYKKIKNKLVLYHGPYYCEHNKRYNLKCKIFDSIFLNKNYKNISIISKSKLATDFLNSKGFKNVETIGVGLDGDNLKEDKKMQYKFSKDKKYLLYIGKLEPRRNIIFLIDILKEVVKYNKNINMLLIGKGSKEYVAKIKQHIENLQLAEYITFIQKVEQKELKNIYSRCELFLLPTNYDIFGMVLLEAMYFGIPVITTLNGGSSTIIKNNYNGFICNLNNQKSWVKCIKKILDNSELQRNIGTNAHKTIEDKFLWKKLSSKFITIYKGEQKHENYKGETK